MIKRAKPQGRAVEDAMKPTHATDCALLWSWLEDAALPEDVAGALDRCLDDLERYDRGMGRNYAEGEWEPLEVCRPITEAVQSALAKAGKADPFVSPPTMAASLIGLDTRDNLGSPWNKGDDS
jgi:hypothetical protein